MLLRVRPDAAPETAQLKSPTAPLALPEPAPVRALATRPPFPAYEATGCVFAATLALADDATGSGHGIDSLDRAPIGVMGDHRHKKGEWMISYRLMHMAMAGIQIVTDSVTPEQVATTVPTIASLAIRDSRPPFALSPPPCAWTCIWRARCTASATM